MQGFSGVNSMPAGMHSLNVPAAVKAKLWKAKELMRKSRSWNSGRGSAALPNDKQPFSLSFLLRIKHHA